MVDPPTSVLAHSNQPRKGSQSPRSSVLHIVFRTPGQVLFCFVWESRYTARSPDTPVSVGERIQSRGLFVFCFVTAKQSVFQLYQERTHVCTVSFFFPIFFRRTVTRQEGTGTRLDYLVNRVPKKWRVHPGKKIAQQSRNNC